MNEKQENKEELAVIGAGPAGLTAAYCLAEKGLQSIVLEKDDVVGGISRTVKRDGYYFDLGGHRFFTKVKDVNDLWHEILPSDEEFLTRSRKSRIYYNGKFFDYPLVAHKALIGLGPKEAFLCIMSFAKAKIFPPKHMDNYEDWVTSRFGKRLYETFFKSYTEKVWGVPASSLPSDWAAQRIKDLSILNAILNPILKRIRRKQITSLIESFKYPKYGPGMMWERAAEQIEAKGSQIIFNAEVTGISHANSRVHELSYKVGAEEKVIKTKAVFSSMPIKDLVNSLNPAPPQEVIEAANDLKYRDFLTVALVVPKERAFPDNWIYIHYPQVKVGRIQNFGAWSPFMVKEGKTCLGMEYFAFEGDELWSQDDQSLVSFAAKELEAIGLGKADEVEKGFVVRVKKAYPHYDENYRKNLEIIRKWLESNTTNLYLMGRNGMHRYNNQDHSMYTAMLSVENYLGATYDVWSVNVEEEYHEEASSSIGERGTGRLAPIIKTSKS